MAFVVPRHDVRRTVYVGSQEVHVETTELYPIHDPDINTTRSSADATVTLSACDRALVLHPHPKLGGSRFDRVTLAIGTALAQMGVFCILPELGGMGWSWTGKNELGVVEMLIRDQLAVMTGSARLFVVGYSFGAALALAAGARVLVQDRIARSKIAGLIAVSYPAGWTASLLLGWMRVPELVQMDYADISVAVIAGQQDSFASTSDTQGLVDWLETNPSCSDDNRVQLVWEPNADHFWVGCIDLVAQYVQEFVAECDAVQTDAIS